MKLAVWLNETTVHSYVMVVKSKNLRATGGLSSIQSQVVNIRWKNISKLVLSLYFHICHCHLFLHQTCRHTRQQFKVKNSLADSLLTFQKTCTTSTPASVGVQQFLLVWLQILCYRNILALSAFRNTCTASRPTLRTKQLKMTSCVVNWPVVPRSSL